MRLWRISDFANLSGQGGLQGPARWHSQAKAIVYLADHPASALLEVLVHLEVSAEDLPDGYQLLAVDVPDAIAFDTATGLPANWRADGGWTQDAGEQWLNGKRTALLRVPSAIAPHCWNWLLNPLHRDASQARVVETIRAAFDPRLFG